MVWETFVQSHVESYQILKKWYLIPPCLALRFYKVRIKGKGSNPEKGVELSPATRCSSYRKGSLRVTLDYSRHLYYLLLWLVDFHDNLNIFVVSFKIVYKGLRFNFVSLFCWDVNLLGVMSIYMISFFFPPRLFLWVSWVFHVWYVLPSSAFFLCTWCIKNCCWSNERKVNSLKWIDIQNISNSVNKI